MKYNNIQSTNDYLTLVKETAKDIAEHALDIYNSEMLTEEDITLEELEVQAVEQIHEWIDSTEIITYYCGQDLICQYSENTERYTNEMSGDFDTCGTFQEVKTNVAYWAFYADVQEHMSDACIEVMTSEVTA